MKNHLKKLLRLLKTKTLSNSPFSIRHSPFSILLCLLSLPLLSQNPVSNKTVHDSLLTDSLFKNKIEVYFKFNITNKSEIKTLTRIISIDNVKNNIVYAYANKKEFKIFLALNYNYTIITNSSLLKNPEMLNNPVEKKNNIWNYYPTYIGYEKLMHQFAMNYPALCKEDTIGILASGRKLLAIHILSKVTQKEVKPNFLYTSTMHGNEPVGYILMLHLIDSLLQGYGNAPAITKLVDNIDIYINPLANPDGVYAGGDSSVIDGTHDNANGVDLNRNYPDPVYGPHPDGNLWQPETQAFMAYATKNHFTMSANFHTGNEVFNYPWDYKPEVTADDIWWRCVGTQFADTVHKYNNYHGYFTDYFDYTNVPGVTDGYTWYQVIGGRQDYMNYFQHCRESTVELSYDQSPVLLPGDSLLLYWQYLYRSFFNYMNKSTEGIRGLITDSVTNKPVRAKVFINGHDIDSSFVYSDSLNGDYYRLIYGGTYNITFSAPGYHSKTINNISLDDNCDSTKTLNVILDPIRENVQLITNNYQLTTNISPNPNNGSFKINFNIPVQHISDVKIFDIVGKEIYSFNPNLYNASELNIESTGLSKGLYFIRINIENNFITLKTIIY